MDIAKYIGLFLLKNNFCYLHGLGNLELKKKPATYEGDALRAPEYDVVLTPGGSIDDTLANFIATHEQTSISKAANSLRDFSTATRAELAAGKEVDLPGVGKFVEAGGLVKFIANPHLQHVPPPVPMIRMAKRLEDAPDFRRDTQDQSGSDSRGSLAWGRIALVALLVTVIAVAVFFVIKYLNRPNEAPKADTAALVKPAPALPVQAPPDTIHASKDIIPASPATTPPVSGPAGSFIVVLNRYTGRGAADKRAAVLTGNGNKVEVMARDSATYFVVTRLNVAAADTVRALDSLRRFFNPKGVYILR